MTEQNTQSLSLEQLQRLQLSPDAVSAQLLQLLETLSSDDQELRAWASDCLQSVQRINQQQADEVALYCSYECEFIAAWACRLLGKYDTVRDYQDQLSEALDNSDSLGVRQAAATALSLARGISDATKASLTKAAASHDARLQRLAREALESIG